MTYSLQIASTALCPFIADNLTRAILFTNNYITSDSDRPDTGAFIEINLTPRSDLNKRLLVNIVEHNTFADMF